jgi:hypothetical protein
MEVAHEAAANWAELSRTGLPIAHPFSSGGRGWRLFVGAELQCFEWPGWREYELSIGHESTLFRWLGLMLLRHKPSTPARYGLMISQVPSNENITQLASHLNIETDF